MGVCCMRGEGMSVCGVRGEGMSVRGVRREGMSVTGEGMSGESECEGLEVRVQTGDSCMSVDQ